MKKLGALFCFVVFSTAPLVWSFETNVLPGEGGENFQTKTGSLLFFAEPSTSSAKVTDLKIEVGESLKFVDRRYRTIKTGKVKVLKSINLNGRFFGDVEYAEYYVIGLKEGEFSLKKGEIFDYLQDRAEGNCFIRVNKEVIEADRCGWMPGMADDERAFQLLSLPTVQAWGLVENKGKRGWLLLNNDSVQ